MAKRYAQMLPIIAALKPSIIVEVGVHKGLRGSALSLEALKHSEQVRYIGFDVFDTMGEQFQRDALNGKRTPTEARARQSFAPIANQHPGFSFTFHVGDTRKTLHGSTVEADFVFIDGDHRVDAIRGDYEALKHCDCVTFDDFYVAGPNGELPNLDQFGANRLVDELVDGGWAVHILPVKDRCNHGAFTQLAVVMNTSKTARSG